jgi:hypothetical protein
VTTASATAPVLRLSIAVEALNPHDGRAREARHPRTRHPGSGRPRLRHGAADEKYDLSRHWRNARTHASHDPVDWKYHHVGNYLLNSVTPPNHGQI